MTKNILVKDLVNCMEAWAPKSLAYEWDNVGLQVGNLEKPVEKVMVTLDVLENVVEEAIAEKVDLIIAHHPLLFQPLKQIDTTTPSGKVIQKLLAHQIAVYAAHTNLDITSGGVNDLLAEKLHLQDTDVLIKTGQQKLYKFAVYVPATHAGTLRQSLGDAGVGHIGNYSHCMFKTDGQGSFKPLSGTNPFIGKQGELEEVDEVRIETILTEDQQSLVLQAMKDAHPYEEPAYDLYPLVNKGESVGLGRIGTLTDSMSLRDLCDYVKERLDITALRVIGDLEQTVNKVAVLGGSGKGFIEQAKQKGADVYITGDMTYHDAQDAWQMGLNVIDPGHHVEKVMKQGVKHYLDQNLENDSVKVIVSNANTEPFQFL
ncbi:Nif3-like dinuclear metal center hexameric protein [Aquibacillus sediminis]|uniref:Nif3-like dinuclear metal center hexameric protein n=1 Tax=Aquibacillus sediminis TaxID=2574734 RepID=UPI001109A63B|nr:Nif3-like dinuclear metal center hexameric protein [Aquibacillus sediminis]